MNPVNFALNSFRNQAAACLLAITFTANAQQGRQDFSKVEIKDTAVAGNVHLLEGAGGNIGASAGPD